MALEPRLAATRVADDGPLIATHERSRITGDAERTRTRHGSGLGLWATERPGGERTFEKSEYGGNVVQLRLPRVR